MRPTCFFLNLSNESHLLPGLFKSLPVRLLAKAPDEGCGFACSRRAGEEAAAIDGHPEDFILVAIKDWLITQAHLR